MNTKIDKKELLAMKLLHYFITEEDYNPVIVHGVQDEIWLENMNNEIKIVRICLRYIHNQEQLNNDLFKVSKLSNQIKRKTFSLKMKTLTFYLDLNERVNLEDTKNHYMINMKSEKSLNKKNIIINDYFPNIKEKLVFTEEGMQLYQKINADIYMKNVDETNKINELFKSRKPIVTNIIMGIITIIMILMYILGNGSEDIETLYNFGALVKDHNILRLFTSIFLHIGIVHFAMNLWAIKILGKEVESLYGHIKYLIIFIYSGVIGNLVSLLLMNTNTISAGASGSIYGLMGALLYFSFNQRTYMAQSLKEQIIPVLFINLLLSFMIPSFNMYAHIGGLLGGILISMATGIKYKTTIFERNNAVIASIILFIGLTYLAYFA